jgi:hypothetical protein
MARIIDGNEMNMVGGRVRELRLARNMSQQAIMQKPAESILLSAGL